MGGWNLPDDVSDNHPIFGPPAGTWEPEVDITEIARVRGVIEDFLGERDRIIDALIETQEFSLKDMQELFEQLESYEEILEIHHSKLDDMGYY